MDSPLITINELAKLLHCCTKTVRRKMESGKLPSVTIGGVKYMTVKQFDKLINQADAKRFERKVG